MKRYNLLDVMNNINDIYIENALKIDNAAMLKLEMQKEKSYNNPRLLKFGIACLSCICIMIVGIITLQHQHSNLNSNDKSITIDSNVKVGSAEELNNYLGINIPHLDKKVKEYIIIKDNENSEDNKGKIVYEDGSQIEVTNNSVVTGGVYTAGTSREEIINGVNVCIYKDDEGEEATWTKDGYSYSYKVNKGEIAKSELEKLIKKEE